LRDNIKEMKKKYIFYSQKVRVPLLVHIYTSFQGLFPIKESVILCYDRQ
jgi:hypothetical protein